MLSIIKYLTGGSFWLIYGSQIYDLESEAAYMEAANPTESQQFGKSPSGSFKKSLADAIRFWERQRLLYNLVLAGVVFVWFVASWPHFRPAMHLFRLFQLIGLGLIANALYCAANVVDIVVQRSNVSANRQDWRRQLWVLGDAAGVSADKLLDRRRDLSVCELKKRAGDTK
jgi:hypothetical protein